MYPREKATQPHNFHEQILMEKIYKETPRSPLPHPPSNRLQSRGDTGGSAAGREIPKGQTKMGGGGGVSTGEGGWVGRGERIGGGASSRINFPSSSPPALKETRGKREHTEETRKGFGIR